MILKKLFYNFILKSVLVKDLIFMIRYLCGILVVNNYHWFKNIYFYSMLSFFFLIRVLFKKVYEGKTQYLESL